MLGLSEPAGGIHVIELRRQPSVIDSEIGREKGPEASSKLEVDLSGLGSALASRTHHPDVVTQKQNPMRCQAADAGDVPDGQCSGSGLALGL